MTESEAKGFIQGKLDCMEKCDVFNREDKHRNNDCDNCEYCYSQGNFGNQKEAFKMAINALEKQIPKKPMMAYDDKIDSNWVSCPICANGIGWEVRARKIKFCWDCGQRLYFGDDEK